MVRSINKSVKLPYAITESSGISPLGNLLNILLSDSMDKIELCDAIPGKISIRMKNPIVITAAIIWFSVILDANIPNAIYAIPIRTNPSIETNAVVMSGFPKNIKIIKYRNVSNTVINKIITADKNFPRTILVTLLGDVNNSCSVPFFLSSANILIVSIGVMNISKLAAE